jgi:serine protease DegS
MNSATSIFRQRLALYGWPALVGLLIAIIVLQRLQPSSANAVSPEKARHSYAQAVALAMPSVVKIYTAKVVASPRHPLLNDPLFKRFIEQRGLSQRDKIERGLGSGVIVRADGYILTNYHVINNADQIRVMLSDGRQRLAQIVGTDQPTDLAVLKIDLQDLSSAKFAHPDSVAIGDVVLAIGNPYGIGQTVTQGIVSATGRYGLQLNTYEKYIQTDAAINQGNSGGALVNADGELIGINSILYSRSGGSNGIGFAIPNDIAMYVLNSIIQHGKVIRGWLGISAEEITPTIAETFALNTDSGLMLLSVVRGGPADRAGLKVGDIVTHINKVKVGSGNDSMHQIAQTTPGSHITILALRDGAAQSFLVEIGQIPESAFTTSSRQPN